MKNQKGFTAVELLMVIWFISILLFWFGNLYKLAAKDDWNAPYRAEAFHVAGVLTFFAAPFTFWVDDTKQ